MTVNDIIQRPTDTELHDVSIGSAGLYPDWWENHTPSHDVDDRGNPVKDWVVEVTIWDLDNDKPFAQGRITADLVWAAALAISTSAAQGTSRETVKQCQRLVYAGESCADFDGDTADQLLQTVVIGYPRYN